MSAAWIVYLKELVDALRDRRTLLMVAISSVATGPLVLLALSALIGSIEKSAERREIMVVNIEAAPTLRNYLERQAYTLQSAPKDFEQQLKDSKLGHPVLVLPDDFEDALASGEVPELLLYTSSGNQRAQTSVGRIRGLMRSFNAELASLRLAFRGVAPEVRQIIEVEERDLSSPATRAAQITGMVPFFVLMAVLYGALNAALDTTAGERERGSLEPLLMNPAASLSLVAGKWGAVATVGMLIAVLSSFSFLPGQSLLRSESLAAMFQYGLREAVLFLALLAPLAAALSGVMMGIAIHCKSFKEAQANNTVVILGVSMLPLVTVFNQGGESPWHLWVPALGQITLMNRVLKGDAVGAVDVLIPLLVSAAVTALALAFIARGLRSVAVR